MGVTLDDLLTPQISRVTRTTDNLVITIYGYGGLGKTPVATKMDKPYYLAFGKSGLSGLNNVPFAPIQSWSEFKQYNKLLCNKKNYEVLHEKYLSRELQMKSADYNIFWESKSIQHPELSTLTTATCARLRQMLFHFMRGCDLLDEKNTIQPLNLSAGNQDLFTRENLNETAFFPLDSRRVTI